MGWLDWFSKRRVEAKQLKAVALEAYGKVRFPYWQDMLRLYPVGTEFQYLGMVFKVVKCNTEAEWWSGVPKAWFWFVCEYADHRGVIREHRFDSNMHKELVRMAKEAGR